MTKPSPRAQAVLDAFLNSGISGAILAAADQVVPEEQLPPRRGMRPGGTGALSPDEGAEDQRAETRRKLRALAYELETLPHKS